MNVVIDRSGQKIVLPKSVLDEIYSSGMYITLNKLRRTYGYYYQPMVVRKNRGRIIFRKPLARMIINAPSWKHVDHIDRDPLNNDPNNLRLASFRENGANRKKAANTKYKYKGVVFSKGSYKAVVMKDKVRYSASSFKTEEEAAKHYDILAKMLFGEFAALNFP